jgi:hypothetical protein
MSEADWRRRLLIAGVVVGALASFTAAMTAITNDLYHHDGKAARAFFTWRENPTAENERAWHAARDAAMVRDLKFKSVCAGVALLSGFAAWRCHRASKSLGSSANGSVANASDSQRGG